MPRSALVNTRRRSPTSIRPSGYSLIPPPSTTVGVMPGSVLGQYEEAIADFDQAIRLQPDSTLRFYISRGHARAVLGQYEEAFADFDQAIRLRPDDAHAYHKSRRMPRSSLVNSRRRSPTLIGPSDCSPMTPIPTTIGALPSRALVNTRRRSPTMIGPSDCSPMTLFLLL